MSPHSGGEKKNVQLSVGQRRGGSVERGRCAGVAACHAHQRPRRGVLVSSRGRHTRLQGDWSSDVCSSDLARAIYFNAKMIIMDEPTAALGPGETAQVRNLIKQLKNEGIGIFLVSHDIHDVFDLSEIGRASCRERV